MKHDNMLPFRRAVFGLLALSGLARALSQKYCSNENTGSGYSAVSNIYQSNGACHDQCSGYAYAVVQYQDCWCSDYTPAGQQSVGDCNEDCPGYPSEQCGNKDEGLYGYIALSASPSGTAGGSSNSPSSTSPPPSTSSEAVSTSPDPLSSASSPQASTPVSSSFYSSTASPVSSSLSSTTTSTSSTSALTSYVQSSTESSVRQTTIYVTPTAVSHSSPSTTLTPSSTPTSTSSSTSSSITIAAVVVSVTTTSASSSSSTHSATPVTSIQVVTVSGAVVTQTVTSLPNVVPDSATESATAQRKSLSGGAIAGAVIGSLLGVAALAFGAFLLWRRKQQDDGGERAGSSPLGRSPKRNTSVLSKTGLLSRGRPASMTEREIDEPISMNTATGSNSVRQSVLFGSTSGAEGVSPVSPLGGGGDNESRRHSKPMVYDQRLNPSALFANDDNGSRISMQDNNDYSRPLGIANPDPRVSHESRISRA